jgi:hypothetical protein
VQELHPENDKILLNKTKEALNNLEKLLSS